MLGNGLGETIKTELGRAERFVDLFSGSGAVAWFAARVAPKEVIAVDLQTYSRDLVLAVVGRTAPIDYGKLASTWIARAMKHAKASSLARRAARFDHPARITKRLVDDARAVCGSSGPRGSVWQMYGGHYFSPSQALAIDYLRRWLPMKPSLRHVAAAALMTAATRCAASPGHLAQPLQPGSNTNEYILSYWNRYIYSAAEKALAELAPLCARVRGRAYVGDALSFASRIRSTDLVFIDPPYSGVQYSRFYHVLETIAGRSPRAVSGVGRYPPRDHRPQSSFSVPTRSGSSMKKLLKVLARRRPTVLITFPQERCSNGLSGFDIRRLAEEDFSVSQRFVASVFSTLGGRETDRKPRQQKKELILTLRPKA